MDGDHVRILLERKETPETWGPAHFWCPACQLPFAKERVRKLAAGERPLTQGDRVLVRGLPGDVVGEVIHACTPYEMPDFGPGSHSHEARQLMDEWKVDFLVLVRRPHGDREQCFFALRHPGGWRDLRGQDLQITKVRKDQ
jgi:hypothetical protein